MHAFRAIGLNPRQVARLVGVGETQVRTDSELAITAHLSDSRIVTAAQSLIHLAIGQGAARDTAPDAPHPPAPAAPASGTRAGLPGARTARDRRIGRPEALQARRKPA